MNRETLGPAERIIQTLLAYSDHMYHNRPGIVTVAPTSVTGVVWQAAARKLQTVDGVEGIRVYRLDKRGAGKKARSLRTLVGTLTQGGAVVGADGRKVAELRDAGIFSEVAAWAYRQVAMVWKLDNELAARWASFAFADKNTSRDMKVVLAAFMLCQSRRGDPVKDNGAVVFFDDDYRDVGEAMALLPGGFDLKLLLRIREVLELPEVAAHNRELGFGRSAREAHLGRWPKVATKWLRFREHNPRVLDGLLKSGFRKSLMKLAKAVGYKPVSPEFFRKLRWAQDQAADGRRVFAIGEKVEAADAWAGLSEAQVCERIVRERPTFKAIVGRLHDGITRAIVAAAVEAGSFSDKDLVIFTPTLEELGLLQVRDIRERWERAVRSAEDQRAANVARNVRSQATKEALQQGADNAVRAAVADVMTGIRVYFMVDISSSMNNAIDEAKQHIEKFLSGFPADRLHISVFNTGGREVTLKHASAAGVAQAFRGITAGGGTDYGAGVRALQHHKPQVDEDVLFIFVGDEEAGPFTDAVRLSGLGPMAFGFVKVRHAPQYSAVTTTAAELGIPCFLIHEKTFADPYAIPRTVRALVASTPVGKAPMGVGSARVSLVEQILKTDLLKKPVWAEAVT
jgi:hypothetical protein